MKKYVAPAALLSCMFALAMPTYAVVILNGSFESGFTNWVTTDIETPHISLAVRSTGYDPGFGIFTASATDGTSVASHGFDGGGGTISFAQDVGPIDLSSAILGFDYRAGWDMVSFGDPESEMLDRVFTVSISPFGGGAPLQTFEILRATGGTALLDTGSLSTTLDLSDHIGTAVRISFDAFIPESFTGPGFLQVDNVVLAAVPEPSTTVFLLGAAALVAVLRRRKNS